MCEPCDETTDPLFDEYYTVLNEISEIHKKCISDENKDEREKWGDDIFYQDLHILLDNIRRAIKLGEPDIYPSCHEYGCTCSLHVDEWPLQNYRNLKYSLIDEIYESLYNLLDEWWFHHYTWSVFSDDIATFPYKDVEEWINKTRENGGEVPDEWPLHNISVGHSILTM